MSKLTEEQVAQVGNIIETLVEATEHLHEKVKNNEMTQSLYGFSSVVEGYHTVKGILSLIDSQRVDENKEKINRVLPLIVAAFENNNLLKVNEIIQFTFLPTIRNLSKAINDEVKRMDSAIIIGIFHSIKNPKDFYTENRLNAMLLESEKQDTKLLFFTSEDVDFENKKVTAYIFENEEWKQINAGFPDVIHNLGTNKQTQVERCLRRYIPFTTFGVGNKNTLPKKMIEGKDFAYLLVPFTVCFNKSQIYRFFERNNKVVFKALGSNRGEDIYFVTKREQRYIVKEHVKEKIMSVENFDRWIDEIILAEKGSYIIQRFILTRTDADEPYHIRAHVQKDGEGIWGLTHIYPRIGNKKSDLSNIATEGRIEDFHDFMVREFKEDGEKYEKEILKLSLEVAHHLDKLYGFSISELGLDFAIDEAGKIWMHEANNGPQTFFHEEKRAVNAIAYAKYIAKNGIFYDNHISKSASGFFQSRRSQLPYFEASERKVLGVLLVNDKATAFTEQLASRVENKSMTCCTFTPKSVDADYGLIRAQVFEHGEWNEKIIEYPDIIYDVSILRDVKDTEWIYEELAEVPFINEWGTETISKTDVLDTLKNQGFQELLPDQTFIKSKRYITKMLEEKKKVLIFNNKMNSLRISIEFLGNNQFAMIHRGRIFRYNRLQLSNYLTEKLTKRRYIVQEDFRSVYESQSFSINTDLVYDENEGWLVAGQYGALEIDGLVDIEEVLQSLYSKEQAEQLIKKASRVSKELASVIRKKYGKPISVLSVALAINKKQEIRFESINLNHNRNIYDEKAYVDAIVQRVQSLIE